MPTIRDAVRSDLDAIVDRWVELMSAHAELHSELYRPAPHGRGTYRSYLRERIGTRRSLVLVAEADDEIVGYIVGGAGLRAPFFELRDVGMVYDIAVAPSWRRKGVARALVEATFDRFRDWDLEHVQVSFSPDNPAASTFWPELGFTPFLTESYKKL